MLSKFKEEIKNAAKAFNSFTQPVRIITHFDSDGLCSAALLSKLFFLEDKIFNLSIVKNLNEDKLKELSNENYETYIFADIGSSQVEDIQKYLKGKKVIILDHHLPKEVTDDNIINLNPLLHNEDKSEFSGSTVTYFFCKEINSEIKNYSHIALIGAVGDNHKTFTESDNEILQDGINANTLSKEDDFLFYGVYSKSIAKLIQHSDQMNVPGITGDKDGSIKFVSNLDIDPNKKIHELTEDERNKLLDALKDYKDKIYGEKITLSLENVNSPYRDMREFSTLLNACGKLNKHDLGIGALLGDKNSKIMAIHTMSEYKDELTKIMKWYKDGDQDIIKSEKYTIANIRERTNPSLIGTMASILSKSSQFNYDFAVVLGREDENTTKISIRTNRDINLKEITQNVFEQIENSNYGGHENGFGALIPIEKEEFFIDNIKTILNKLSMEEVI